MLSSLLNSSSFAHTDNPPVHVTVAQVAVRLLYTAFQRDFYPTSNDQLAAMFRPNAVEPNLQRALDLLRNQHLVHPFAPVLTLRGIVEACAVTNTPEDMPPWYARLAMAKGVLLYALHSLPCSLASVRESFFNQDFAPWKKLASPLRWQSSHVRDSIMPWWAEPPLKTKDAQLDAVRIAIKLGWVQMDSNGVIGATQSGHQHTISTNLCF